MFHWKVIILIIIIKILSFILSQYYTNNHVNKVLNKENSKNTINVETEEKDICITPVIKDFTICWVKFSVEMINYSRSILSKSPDHNTYYLNLEATKDELTNLFSKIYSKNTDEFKNLINEQMSLKIELCNAILYKDNENIDQYSKELVKNTQKLSDLFNKLKKNKEDDVKLKDAMDSHTSKYIKSMHFINKAGNDELSRELVLGSIDSAKLLF